MASVSSDFVGRTENWQLFVHVTPPGAVQLGELLRQRNNKIPKTVNILITKTIPAGLAHNLGWHEAAGSASL